MTDAFDVRFASAMVDVTDVVLSWGTNFFYGIAVGAVAVLAGIIREGG